MDTDRMRPEQAIRDSGPDQPGRTASTRLDGLPIEALDEVLIVVFVMLA